jgi:predicted anti-sigma-YlaC factor YlaD
MNRSVGTICVLMTVAAAASGCSLKSYAINMVGDALSSGDSVYESDEDIELVGSALPFGLKLTESLLAQSPRHPGLLLTACRGFTLYSYAYVGYEAEQAADNDLDRARKLRARARRLYLRAYQYGVRGIERSYPGFGAELQKDSRGAVARFKHKDKTRDLPFLYWTAASLGLAISVSTDDAAMLGRLPDVQAVLDRALALDEAWDEGALHEFSITLAGARPGAAPDVVAIKKHYDRAVELSRGKSASVHLAYAEAVSVPEQNGAEFRDLIKRALAIDPDSEPSNRLVNQLAHRRARWLESRADDLILGSDDLSKETAAEPAPARERQQP